MRGVIFDFDGPIFDGRSASAQALEKTFKNFEKKIGRPQLDPSGLPLYDPKRLIALAYAEFDLSEDVPEEIREYYCTHLRNAESLIQVGEPVKTVIERLHEQNHPLAVLSARLEANLVEMLRHVGLHDYFDVIAGRDSTNASKPRFKSVQFVAEELGVEPQALVFVGDSDMDYDAAYAAGACYYHAAWTREPNGRAYVKANIVLHRPEDLLAAFESITPLQNASARTLPSELNDAIEAEAFSFYAGAGVSVPSGIGGWEKHYLPILRDLRVGHLVDDHELPDLLQLLAADQTRTRRLFDRFQESFDRPRLRANAYHFAMLRSGAQYVWTSNYDQLFNDANIVGEFGRRIAKNDTELLENFRDQKLVIKMNGDFLSAHFQDDLDWDMVFLREQFDLADHRRREIWRLFEDDYRNKSIIFVGVSFKDPGLRRIVTIAASRVPRTRHKHYLLMKAAQHPVEQGLHRLNLDSLRRFGIETLFFDDFRDIQRFVETVALVANRPVVGFSGNADVPADDSPSNLTLAKGQMSIVEMEDFCTRLGQELAAYGFRVTSGHGPYVGIPAVSAAFEKDPKLARFYLRMRGKGDYDRTAPAIVVPGETFEKMRERFIPELSLLLAIGGKQYEETKPGVITEIEMAMDKVIPVILVPQAGGDVAQYTDDFMCRIDATYRDPELARVIKKANDKVWNVPAKKLITFASKDLPGLIEHVIAAAMGASVPWSSTGSGVGTYEKW